LRVFVKNMRGKPLMPTTPQKAKRLLREGKAKVVMAKPFTIQLTCATGENKQPIDLGGDPGYSDIGFSAVTAKEELFSGDCHLLEGQVERNKERRMYRRQRRSRLRYRAPRLDNRKKPEGWLAPSIENKKDTHLRLIDFVKTILPITSTTIEVAAFDIQKINNPGIEGKEYQQGDQLGFWNVREYAIHRDGHKCQNPNCKNHSKEKVLQVHHVGYWKGDRTDRPGNFTTLCDKCHTPANHQPDGFLYGWQPKPGHAPAAFMNIVRWQIVNELGCDHTYGYVTKSKRIGLGLPKTHANDAFVIAGGTNQERCIPVTFVQNRHNNRSLERFYDAKYIDIRTGEKTSGKDLFSGRRTRNKNLNGPNLHTFRGEKLSKGRRSIKRQKYALSPGDTVVFEKQKHVVKGMQNLGAYVNLEGLSKPVKTANVRLLCYGKGLQVA
jgi:hypothetical protein